MNQIRSALLGGAVVTRSAAGVRRPPAGEDHRGSPPPARGERFASFAPSTYDAEAHTVELVLSAGTRIQRWYGLEELMIDEAAIDLSRVAAGKVKVLDSHNAWEIGAILGTVLSARIVGGQLLGLMKFDTTARAVEAEGMVARGVLTSVSIGYQVSVWRVLEIIVEPESGNETYVWVAASWQLLEASFVSVPADPNAGVRSAVASPSGATAAASGATEEDTDMQIRSAAGAPAAPATPTPAPVAEPVRAAEATLAAPAAAAAAPAPAAPAASAVSRFTATQSLDFVEQARTFGVEEQARTLVGQNERGEVSVESAREAILRAAAERQRAQTAAVPAAGAARVVGDDTQATREAIVEAMVARSLGRAPGERAREYMNHRILELMIMRTPGLNPRERDAITILRAANTSGDFPMLLEAAANKILLDRYQAAAPTFRAIARQRNLRDFKLSKLLRVGDFPTLLKYQEDGEIKSGTINEGRETVTLGSYGRILRLSRQALVNDDLGAFDDVFGSIGTVVAQFENATFYAVKNLASGLGPALADTYTVFEAAHHKNYTSSGTAISVDSLGVGRAAIRKQTNIDGNPINAAARTLLVSPDKETIAEQYVSVVQPVVNSSVNPFAGKLQVVSDAALTGNAWELYADPSVLPVWAFGYLADAPGPRILTEEPFNTDGIAMRVTLDFYAGAIDYRGGYRNAGA
jgi:phage head maturation protease